MDLLTCIWVIGLTGILIFLGTKHFKNQKRQNILKKWNGASKDKVILHGMYGNKYLPTPSPFVLKLETYLRMMEIPYEIDKEDIWGPKGKTPWISYNGTHLGDSQMIVEYLGRKFDKVERTNYNDEQQAIGTAVRIMLEEYVYWGGVLWRFAFGGSDTLEKLRTGEITLSEWLIFHMIAPSLKSMAWSQGLGRHSEAEVLDRMKLCLCSFSKILGRKKFLLGNEPCEDDCAAFGILASSVYIEDSPFSSLLSGEFKNIREYCDRIKESYWKDWH